MLLLVKPFTLGPSQKLMGKFTFEKEPPDQYLRNFSWNKVKYRVEMPIGELINTLHKEVVSLDNDLKQKYTQYQSCKSSLAALERKQTGNLSAKSLFGIVSKDDLVTDSEYLETLLVAVPNPLERDWLRSYETLAPMVVPPLLDQAGPGRGVYSLQHHFVQETRLTVHPESPSKQIRTQRVHLDGARE